MEVGFFYRTFVGVLTVVLMACQGPVGPVGPQGERGEQGPEGQISEGTFIRVGNLSRALYDGFGRIIIEDRLITPKTYRGIYIEVSIEDWTAFYEPPQLFNTEIVMGRVVIHDPTHYLISYRDNLKEFSLFTQDGVETASFEDGNFVLMVLVQ